MAYPAVPDEYMRAPPRLVNLTLDESFCGERFAE
jgi:hypothetical protein